MSKKSKNGSHQQHEAGQGMATALQSAGATSVENVGVTPSNTPSPIQTETPLAGQGGTAVMEAPADTLDAVKTFLTNRERLVGNLNERKQKIEEDFEAAKALRDQQMREIDESLAALGEHENVSPVREGGVRLTKSGKIDKRSLRRGVARSPRAKAGQAKTRVRAGRSGSKTSTILEIITKHAGDFDKNGMQAKDIATYAEKRGLAKTDVNFALQSLRKSGKVKHTEGGRGRGRGGWYKPV